MKVQDSMSVEYFYKHSPGKVWAAITREKEISKWFIKADFKPEVGYKYTFTHEDTIVTGKILEVAKNKKLVYTWVVGDTKVETKVTWLLIPMNDGTLLQIEHSGFLEYGKTAEDMFGSTVKGWDMVFHNLEKHLNK